MFVNIPVRRHGDVIGHLGLGAKHDQTGFNDQDETVAIALATVASNAVELAAATVQQHQRHLILLDDPDPIIRDLFSLGLELHKLTSTLISADDRANMISTVDTIDQAIRQIRTVAFTPW